MIDTELEKEEKEREKRQKRINLYKKIISFLPLLILIPTIFCVILFVRVNSLEHKLDMLIETIETSEVTVSKNDDVDVVYAQEPETDGTDSQSTEEPGTEGNSEEVTTEADEESISESATEAESEAVNETQSESESETAQVMSPITYSEEQIDEALAQGRKVVYLTFDDGPSGNTYNILDILDTYGIKATFFTVGKDADTYSPMYNRIVDDGHTLAMHSYTHVYDEIYANVEAFDADFNKISSHLESITGKRPTIYRFPGGSSNLVSGIPMTNFIKYLNDKGIKYFDWNSSSEDAKADILTVEQILDNVFAGIMKEDICVVLMHDADNLTTTVEALPIIIERLQEMDAVILPITENTTLIQHIDSSSVK